MVGNTDEASIYCMIPFLESLKRGQIILDLNVGGFGSDQRLYFLTWMVAHGYACFVIIYEIVHIYFMNIYECVLYYAISDIIIKIKK